MWKAIHKWLRRWNGSSLRGRARVFACVWWALEQDTMGRRESEALKHFGVEKWKGHFLEAMYI